MSRYIRTKDGRIVDVQKFIDETKDTPYYYDFKFDEIKNEEDSCVLNWTAVGSKENSIKEQVGKRCQFGVTISSPFIAQADTIEKLCDRYVLHHTDIIFLNKEHTKYRFENEPNNWYDITDTEIRVGIYGAIWTDKGLIYVAKMNEKRRIELL